MGVIYIHLRAYNNNNNDMCNNHNYVIRNTQFVQGRVFILGGNSEQYPRSNQMFNPNCIGGGADLPQVFYY